ncbi:MAG: peptide-methionine (S)-S-oxide reductase MsrA [Anaerolineaceae bacterium]|nr:peptide-methionine (S)-S-oxide reductase MsrA [Anaerolineaceae bacterium]
MEDYALFAGGCFWGLEAAFSALPGVLFTRVGYAGGDTANPTYKDVCRELTGHAETVLVIYDPQVITYKQLLEAFFSFNEGGCACEDLDSYGSQYRSIVFYNSEEERKTAQDLINLLNKSAVYDTYICTALVKTKNFYLAEEYHQQYYEKHGLLDAFC